MQLKKEHPSWGAPKIREKLIAADECLRLPCADSKKGDGLCVGLWQFLALLSR